MKEEVQTIEEKQVVEEEKKRLFKLNNITIFFFNTRKFNVNVKIFL